MNRKTAAALAALPALALAGCQTLATINPSLSPEYRATQALYVAEAAFSGASLTLETATDRGLLKGSAAATARKSYEEGHEALLAARRARTAGDFALELARSSEATAAAGRLQAASGPTSDPEGDAR